MIDAQYARLMTRYNRWMNERLYAAADASADYAEGRRAFAEIRAPRFTGS